MTNILVVDDIESHLYLAKSLLEPYGYRVTVCSGHEAAMHALATSGPYDMILSDIGMPGSSGFDFIKQVKADVRFKNIPFVFITATYWGEDDRRKGLELGASKFIFRPLEARAILTEVEDVLPPDKRLSGKHKHT